MSRLSSAISVAVFIGVGAWTSSASAVEFGYISGDVWLWNKNGNYCPSNADCTGSMYPSSLYDTWEPIRNAIVEVHKRSNGALIGQGTTDDNGNFYVRWSVPTGQPIPSAELWFLPRHKDNRFVIKTTGGTIPVNVSGAITLKKGQPVYPGSIGVGSSDAPHPYWNAYWAAERLWRETYAYVGVLADNFTNVEIRGFADSVPGFLGDCSRSCTSGAQKRTQLDANAQFAPQHRVMHEMGHVANYVLHPYRETKEACYPNAGGGCAWSQGVAEWGSFAFEEAIATLGANATLWWPDATTPTSCYSSGGTCYYDDGSPIINSNIEQTSYPFNTNNCRTDEGRWVLSHMRFHWDVCDSNNDADGDTIQEGFDCFSCIFTNLTDYANGTGANQIDEPWSANYSGLDNRDGRGSASWEWNYNAHVTTFDWLRLDNCSPP